jgi:two-component system, response regulator PdtaR
LRSEKPLITHPDCGSVKGSLAAMSANGVRALFVLLVEDEALLRIQAAVCLRDAGFMVVESGSGEEAIALSNSGRQIDVLFTDINLGDAATGRDVADICRTHRPDLPVLYTSGKSVDPERCVPGSQFLAKPYRPNDILTAVSAIMRH